jgi:hypothetical protein
LQHPCDQQAIEKDLIGLETVPARWTHLGVATANPTARGVACDGEPATDLSDADTIRCQLTHSVHWLMRRRHTTSERRSVAVIGGGPDEGDAFIAPVCLRAAVIVGRRRLTTSRNAALQLANKCHRSGTWMANGAPRRGATKWS